jgi:hypothetical protein
MKYFPKSRVLTNQKANQGQFKTSDGKPYSGPYYTTFKGESFTGINPTSGSSLPLINTPLMTDSVNLDIDTIKKIEYNALNSSSDINLINPTPFTPRPTEADYRIGKITRYLARQRSGTTFRIMEIDKATYDAFQNNNTKDNYSLWKSISIFWQISGPLRNERINNITTRAGIIDTNQRVLDNTEKNFIGIKQYLTNLTQFSR